MRKTVASAMRSRILGHRGTSADRPENTLEAFVEAAAQGADGTELDVMVCGSGELIVCHDEWLDRLAGEHREVIRTPWNELRRIDVGSKLGFRPAHIPLLAEVIDTMPKDFVFNVELKCITVDDYGLSEKTAELVLSMRAERRIFFSSFNPLCLLRLARRFPQLPRGFLIDPDRPWTPQAWFWLPLTASTSVHPHWTACTPERISAWHRRSLEVVAWTVDDELEARRLQSLGVDWLITNTPAKLRSAIDGSHH